MSGPPGLDGAALAPRYWFLAKQHGWGWGLPVTWQGWAAMAVFVFILVGEFWLPPLPPHSVWRYCTCQTHPLNVVWRGIGRLVDFPQELACWRENETRDRASCFIGVDYDVLISRQRMQPLYKMLYRRSEFWLPGAATVIVHLQAKRPNLKES
jgi:hypothetical protein